jgi:hypothetical protein
MDHEVRFSGLSLMRHPNLSPTCGLIDTLSNIVMRHRMIGRRGRVDETSLSVRYATLGLRRGGVENADVENADKDDADNTNTNNQNEPDN